MREVLGWCEANEVPFMAHTNLSNGVSKEFEALAGSAYWAMALSAFPRLRHLLRTLYDETATKGDAALANRFMYGTDWEMTLTEGFIDSYLSQFVDLLDELQGRPAIQAQGLRDLSSKFFGGNAVEWIGLRKSEAARTRLATFYKTHGVPHPDWARKIDSPV